MPKRKVNRAAMAQLRDIDYWNKLSEKDREYLFQFCMEYYQADFQFEEPIHPKDFYKDCRQRNNAAKRQMHSVGEDVINESARLARLRQRIPKLQNRYYTAEDYDKDYPIEPSRP